MSFRILYAAGPGDVIGTYEYWKKGEDDPSSVAITYSGQFYDACEDLDAQAFVIASCNKPGEVRDGRFRIQHRPVPLRSRRGLLYHIGQVWYNLRLIASAVRFRADVAVIGGISHWFVFSLLSLFGVAVVPTLHCAFWPTGRRPSSAAAKVLQKMNGFFWRRCAAATICVSPECERQVLTIAGRPKGPILQAVAQYRRECFEDIPQPRWASRPFRVMFAGRVEENKGVFHLLEAAVKLEGQRPGEFAWEVCGDGSALEGLRDRIEQAGLANSFALHGRLERNVMREALGRSHVVIVPTTSAFAEGLNKVVVEGVLAGRPVVVSQTCHAGDYVSEALMEVGPGDIDAYVESVRHLAKDHELYEQKRHACGMLAGQFYDEARGWGVALGKSLVHVTEQKNDQTLL